MTSKIQILKSKIFFLLIISFGFFSLIRSSQAAVLFEDDFDSHADWTVQQPTSGTGSCFGLGCDVPSGWTARYNGMSHCYSVSSPQSVGYNNMYIDNIPGYPYESIGGCYGSGGKCLTFWQESCTDDFEDSDGNIGVDLGENYQDIYLRYKIKFGRKSQGEIFELKRADNINSMTKLAHLQGWSGESNPFNYFCRDAGNAPEIVPGITIYNEHYYNYWAQRCYSETDSCEETYYYCNADPAWNYDGGDINYYDIGLLTSTILDGDWHTFEWRFRLNTFNALSGRYNNDGVFQFFYDGNLTDNRSNVVYLEGLSLIDRGLRFVAVGGNNYNRWTTATGVPVSQLEQWYAIDDVVVSTTYVGPDYVIGETDTTPPSAPSNLAVQ